MVSNRQLRTRARRTLGNGILTGQWIYALLITVIASVITVALDATGIGILCSGIISFGVSKYYLCRSRNTIRHDHLDVLLDGVKTDVGGNIVLGILIPLFTLLWSAVLLLFGIVKSYSYSMASFIKVDHPELTATQAITESRRIMNGHKWQLFWLDLSFIGWILVGIFTFGIGLLWVGAYMQAAKAEFYREIINDSDFYI